MEVYESAPVNPESGIEVRFARISDQRNFQLNPRQPNIPSLKNGEEIGNPDITSRALARKRNTFGQALGDILLPEGQTIMMLVEESLAKGFRESGYRVLTEDDEGYADAGPLEVDIEKFWSWFNPGFWAISLNCEIEIKVSGPVQGFESGQMFNARVRREFQTGQESNWQKTIRAALDALNEDISQKIAGEMQAGRSLKRTSPDLAVSAFR